MQSTILFRYPVNLVFILLAGFFMIASCKKEYPSYPYNEIIAFTVEDAQGHPLEATILNDTILVYWPPMQEVPAHVTADMQVSQRAVVTPASGTKLPFKKGTTLTVKAENGSVRTYYLYPVIQQPMPYLKVGGVFMVDNTIGLTGDYIIPDLEQTHVFLIHRSGEEQPVNEFVTIITNYFINFSESMLRDSGQYRFKVVTGNRTILTDPFMITHPEPAYAPMRTAMTLQAGASFLIAGKYSQYSTIEEVYFMDTGTGDKYPLLIEENTAAGIQVKIPADMPAGTYRNLYVAYSFYNNDVKQKSISCNITVLAAETGM